MDHRKEFPGRQPTAFIICFNIKSTCLAYARPGIWGRFPELARKKGQNCWLWPRIWWLSSALRWLRWSIAWRWELWEGRPGPTKAWPQISVLEAMDELLDTHVQASLSSSSQIPWVKNKARGWRSLWCRRWNPVSIYPKQVPPSFRLLIFDCLLAVPLSKDQQKHILS